MVWACELKIELTGFSVAPHRDEEHLLINRPYVLSIRCVEWRQDLAAWLMLLQISCGLKHGHSCTLQFDEEFRSHMPLGSGLPLKALQAIDLGFDASKQDLHRSALIGLFAQTMNPDRRSDR